jgi:hypothetical protein
MSISPVFYGSPSARFSDAFITSGIILIAAAVMALFIGVAAAANSWRLSTSRDFQAFREPDPTLTAPRGAPRPPIASDAVKP